MNEVGFPDFFFNVNYVKKKKLFESVFWFVTWHSNRINISMYLKFYKPSAINFKVIKTIYFPLNSVK